MIHIDHNTCGINPPLARLRRTAPPLGPRSLRAAPRRRARRAPRRARRATRIPRRAPPSRQPPPPPPRAARARARLGRGGGLGAGGVRLFERARRYGERGGCLRSGALQSVRQSSRIFGAAIRSRIFGVRRLFLPSPEHRRELRAVAPHVRQPLALEVSQAGVLRGAQTQPVETVAVSSRGAPLAPLAPRASRRRAAGPGPRRARTACGRRAGKPRPATTAPSGPRAANASEDPSDADPSAWRSVSACCSPSPSPAFPSPFPSPRRSPPRPACRPPSSPPSATPKRPRSRPRRRSPRASSADAAPGVRGSGATGSAGAVASASAAPFQMSVPRFSALSASACPFAATENALSSRSVSGAAHPARGTRRRTATWRWRRSAPATASGGSPATGRTCRTRPRSRGSASPPRRAACR